VSIAREKLHAILYDLPEKQRESAAQRIVHADAAGWRDISVWVWICTRRHEADLVGITPKGTMAFLAYEGTTVED